MTIARPDAFRPIGRILVANAMSGLLRAPKLPLRISCLGIASYDPGGDAESFERMIPLEECSSPEEALRVAALCLSRGDIGMGSGNFPCFQPHIMLIQDHEQGLVLAGEIRAAVILWQNPVASDAEARQVVTEASRLRGMAFRTADAVEARRLQDRAAVLEARLVDPFWRATAADLLRLPQAT